MGSSLLYFVCRICIGYDLALFIKLGVGMIAANNNASVSAPEGLHATIAGVGIQPYYRAEYNPLSARWMVLDVLDQCHAAGLSRLQAEALAGEYNQ